MRKLILVLFLSTIAALVLAACSDDGEESLVIAVQPTATAEQLSDQAKELETFLEDQLGNVDVELRFPTSYAGVVEALRFGHADAAFMSAWPAALAKEYAGAEVALAEVREVVIDGQKTEAPYYYSYWVVPKDSAYNSLSELKGKKVSFASLLSTSGYVAPMARLVELGLIKEPETGKEANAKEFFSDVLFAGGYAQSWEALKRGQVDVAIIAGDVPESLYREVLDNTKVLDKQGPLPSHSVVFSKDLKGPLRGKLLDALMKLGEPEHRELMRKFVSGIFVRFEPATTEEHIGALQSYLDRTHFAFTESLR